MGVLLRLWQKNRGVSFSQALREVKARITELSKDTSLNPVAFLIEKEKASMMTNELEEFESKFGDYSGTQDSGAMA